jgi:hypothetical protein
VSLGRYALGVALLVAVVASSALGGLRLRRRLLPLWTGAPARLAEAMIALTIVVAVAESLGAVGLLRMPFVVAGCVAGGLAVGRGSWPAHLTSDQRPYAPAVPGYAVALAITAAILVLAQWAATLGTALHGGMTGPDTLGYHGPIAATFVQRASIVHPPFIYTDPAIASFPATSELVHAIGILLFSRDLLSPFINLAWLGLALLASWCIGRPRGMGPASLLVALVLLNLPAFSASQPSSGDNDVMALALLLSSLALLCNAEAVDTRGARVVASSPAVIALAGAAAGFALATKVTMLAPVGLLVIAVLVALRGGRNRLTWLISVLATSGIWFLRNLIAFGNPVPAVRLGIGPLALPSAHVPTGATVADYFTDGAVWRELFLPGLHAGFTFMWPVILGAALAGTVAGTVRGVTRLDRLLGVVAMLSAVAYALTPRTGFPFLVAINLRYLGPALVFGLVLLFRVPAASMFRRPWVLALLAAGVVVDLANRGFGPRVLGFPLLGPTPHFVGTTAMWIGVALAVAGTWLALTHRTVTIRGWVALLALAVLGLALRPAEQTYLRTRYSTGPLAFARPLHRQRIAIVGFLQPYPAFGLDLSNSVTEIAHHGPHGAQTLIRSCREWRQALTTGRYDYVITSPPYALVFRSAPDYAAWTRSDPAATVTEVSPDGIGGAITVFKLHGPLRPDLCG